MNQNLKLITDYGNIQILIIENFTDIIPISDLTHSRIFSSKRKKRRGKGGRVRNLNEVMPYLVKTIYW